jgi:hypothetical protein
LYHAGNELKENCLNENLLCYKDEDEVEKITGYKSKGMSVLAFDEVITAYQTHFHEVAHILINFKLQNLGLYTLPFFMEGFAVAVGGRGGMAPRVVTDLGYYLQKTGFLTYDSILTFESFYSEDANLTYAVSGLYNRFLLDELGGVQYLELYKKMNGDFDYVKNIQVYQLLLPDKNIYETYLDNLDKVKLMYFDENDTIKPIVNIHSMPGDLEYSNNYYKFFISEYLYIGPPDKELGRDYYSRKYYEFTEDSGFYPLKYCIYADSNSIRIYNLYNEELIFSHNKNFSMIQKNIPQYKGFYTFFIKRELFNFELDESFSIEGTH